MSADGSDEWDQDNKHEAFDEAWVPIDVRGCLCEERTVSLNDSIVSFSGMVEDAPSHCDNRTVAALADECLMCLFRGGADAVSGGIL